MTIREEQLDKEPCITITATFDSVEQAQEFLSRKDDAGVSQDTIATLQETIDKLTAENKSLNDKNNQLDFNIGELEKKLVEKPDLTKVKTEARLQGRKDAIQFMNDKYNMAKVTDWAEKQQLLLNLPTEPPAVAPENK